MKKTNILMVVTVAVCCAVMALVDGVIQPGYWVKSGVKLALFLAVPLIFSRFDKNISLKSLFRFDKKVLGPAAAVGGGIFVLILGGYFALRGVFDFSGIADSLMGDAGVGRHNFAFVAIYIAVVNSFLEEFFFRGFAFLTLRGGSAPWFAYVFSAAAFSLYHVAMMIGWFSPALWVLVLVGLFAGGLIFNYFNSRSGTVYPSWLVHMCANLAINTVGIILIYS